MTKIHKPIPHAHLRSHHKKPYRAHHVTLAGLAILLILTSLVFLAVFYLTRQTAPPTQREDTTRQEQRQVGSQVKLRSNAGHTLPVDLATFAVTVRDSLDDVEPREISNQQDANEQTALQFINIEPKPGNSEPDVRASSLEIRYTETDQSNPELIAQNILDTTESGSYKLVAETTETLAGNEFRKFSYRYQSEITSSAEVYRVIWVANINNLTYTISLQGLIGDPAIPAIYAQVLNEFSFGETLGLQFVRQLSGNWVSRSESNNQYLSDLVSPAVTKIYHIVCASISFEFESASEQQCRAVTGSGFLISNDGYIATNGHVVVYEPADVLVNTLLANPLELSSFLTSVVGLDSTQISRLRSQPEELAAIVAKIYELPDDAVTFRNKQEVILVALGDQPLQPENEADILDLFSFRNTRDIKKAELIDYSYSGKDQLNLASGSEEGFTSSDVALLKVSLDNAPFIQLGAPADIAPGQQISLLGFPNDAENQLVDTSEMAVSITNGTISSVRTAAGGEGQLLQTDTDASQGNSGGPAVNAEGKALGLLTYRFKDDTTQNAAKSYVRDIADVRDLLSDQSITLNVNSPVQQAWNNGLEHYSQSRFRDALPEFETVVELYPAHRLAQSYINASEQNIAQGLDKSESPIMFFAGILIGAGMLALSIKLMRHHRLHHHAYKAREAANAQSGIMSP